MKKVTHPLFMLGCLLVACGLFLPQTGLAGVHVSVGINLPVFTFAAPPPMVVVPGTYAYYAPDADLDIFFYQGYWYRPYEGRWFRARGYNGPWINIVSTNVPRVVVDLPPDYRHHAHAGYERIPYGQLKKNWRRWEHEKHWDKQRHAAEFDRARAHARGDNRYEERERHREDRGDSRGHRGDRGRDDRGMERHSRY